MNSSDSFAGRSHNHQGPGRGQIIGRDIPGFSGPLVDSEGVPYLVQYWWAPMDARDGKLPICFIDFLGRRFEVDQGDLVRFEALYHDPCDNLECTFYCAIRELIEDRRDLWWVPAPVHFLSRFWEWDVQAAMSRRH